MWDSEWGQGRHTRARVGRVAALPCEAHTPPGEMWEVYAGCVGGGGGMCWWVCVVCMERAFPHICSCI